MDERPPPSRFEGCAASAEGALPEETPARTPEHPAAAPDPGEPTDTEPRVGSDVADPGAASGREDAAVADPSGENEGESGPKLPAGAPQGPARSDTAPDEPPADPDAAVVPADVTPSDQANPDAAPAPEPCERTVVGTGLTVEGLALRTTQGPVFGPVDWLLPPGTHGAVLGVQGSGRSAFLLALAGRMRGLTGSLRVDDLDGVRRPRHLRRCTSVARITDIVELEPSLTVAEAVDEHALLEGVSTRRGRQVFADLTDAVDVRFDPTSPVHELPAVERTLLAALLACQRPTHHVVLDDVDDGLTLPQLHHVYRVLDELGRLGHHFVVSALDSSPVPAGASVLRLGPPETDDALGLSFRHLHPHPTMQES